MATPHVAVVQAGRQSLDQWRERNPSEQLSAPGAALDGLDLAGSDFRDANLEGASFRKADLAGAIFSRANLVRASFIGASVTNAKFEGARLDGADFAGARVTQASFAAAISLNRARGLLETTVEDWDSDLPEFVTSDICDRWGSWKDLRTIGRLPLFTPAYVGLSITFIYFSVLGSYDSWIVSLTDSLRSRHQNASVIEFIEKTTRALERVGLSEMANWIRENTTSQRLEAELHHLIEGLMAAPPGTRSLMLLLATLSLALGSTIYLIFCPQLVQSFSYPEWRYSLKRPALHYAAASWTAKYLRMSCVILYAIGGGCAVYLILWNLYKYSVVIMRGFG